MLIIRIRNVSRHSRLTDCTHLNTQTVYTNKYVQNCTDTLFDTHFERCSNVRTHEHCKRTFKYIDNSAVL